MGEVYRARDPERVARFKREAQVVAALNHPHIAAIYGLEESDGVTASCWNWWKVRRWRRDWDGLKTVPYTIAPHTIAVGTGLQAGPSRLAKRSRSRGRSQTCSGPRTRRESSTARRRAGNPGRSFDLHPDGARVALAKDPDLHELYRFVRFNDEVVVDLARAK